MVDRTEVDQLMVDCDDFRFVKQKERVKALLGGLVIVQDLNVRKHSKPARLDCLTLW